MTAEFVLDGRAKVADDLPFAVIRSAIADSAVSEIVLIFVNTNPFLPDSVLALRSLLLERRAGVVLKTILYSNITDPDILLFLTGDIRIVANPYIKVFIQNDKTDKNTGASSNRAAVSKLLQQYLPLENISGHWLSKKDLSDWGLIDDSPLHNYLKEIQGELQEF